MMGQAFVAPRGCFRLAADWPDPFAGQPGHTSHPPKAGALVWEHPRAPGRIWSLPSGGGFQRKPDELELEPHPRLSWRDFPIILDWYLSGKARLPNLRAVPTDEGLRSIAAWGGAKGRPSLDNVLIPGDLSNWGTWARVLLGVTQGGQVDGTGILIAYIRRGQDLPPIYRFALCEHRKVDSAGANHMRGWHPGHCVRCGLNMTVDSSD